MRVLDFGSPDGGKQYADDLNVTVGQGDIQPCGEARMEKGLDDLNNVEKDWYRKGREHHAKNLLKVT